jgi:small neutral amino acid transporter SnatA (MarC family)
METLAGLDLDMIGTVALLLLIGMGPKIALVPFLEKTKGFAPERQRAIGRRMVLVGVSTAVVLFVAGGYLMTLLHVSPGALGVGGGIILLIIALGMIAGPGKKHVPDADDSPESDMNMAVYPLAVPYLINPAGMVILIVAGGRLDSVFSIPGLIMLGMILLVGLFDFLVFGNIDKIAKRLRPVTLVISEVVFGLLLTALSIEMMVAGLRALGVIAGAPHGH